MLNQVHHIAFTWSSVLLTDHVVGYLNRIDHLNSVCLQMI